jgi:FMN-dependent NADH-azoreductase
VGSIWWFARARRSITPTRAQWDGAVPYLRCILGFIGIIEVEVIRIEGLNIPDLALQAIPRRSNA